ncbi:MAG: LPS-assembly protein LptD, partial [Halieaceae bacterium]|nr:LPS-assembly protein LptD [Halieaceae bacterium]
MITDFARHIARRGRFLVPAVVLLVNFAMPAPLQAKNTNYQVCKANASGDGWDCQSTQPGAADTPAAPASARASEQATAAPAPAAAVSQPPAPAAAPAAPGAEPIPEAPAAVVPAAISGAVAAGAATAAEAPSAEAAPPPDQQVAVADEPAAATPPPTYPLDWVPLESVPAALRDTDCLLCEGRYMDPLADQDLSQDPDDAEIEAWANSTELQGDQVWFTGGVRVTQGYRRFQGNEAVIDRETGEAVLTGDVTLREPGVLLQGQRAQIFSETGEATLEDSKFVIHPDHLQGTADLLERDADGLIHIHNGNFSYCPPGENDWSIHADKLQLDIEEGLGTARGATVDVAGLPVFYTPWLQFPLDDRRRTGLLWPDFGNDSSGG